MDRTEALRYVVAASDDVALAAWISVIHLYGLPAVADVSPYDHREAYERFYRLGFLSPLQVDYGELCAPDSADVQAALEHLRFLCPEHQPEKSMSKKLSAFKNDQSIARKDDRGLSSSSPGHTLGMTSRRPTGGLSAFSPQREAMPAAKQPGGLSAFSQEPRRAGLSCANPDARTYAAGTDLNMELYCCGQKLVINDEGGEILGPEDLPNSSQPILEYLFHAECDHCNAVHHISSSKPIPRDTY